MRSRVELKQVFRGIKVVDFSWVAAGPQAARTLAEHGATVVRVESHRKPDTIRLHAIAVKDFKPGIDRSGHQAIYNTNKYGMSLDLAHPMGQEIARKLIGWADIAIESFTPGQMRKWGLDYDEAKKVKADIIYCSSTMQGQRGPRASFKGYGHHAAALVGFHELAGDPDGRPALGQNAYIDFIAPWYSVIAIIGALERRRRTGKGIYIDQSQLEVGANFLAPAILDYTVNGRIMSRMGNRDPYAAPHGVYRCQGDDRWVVITVFSDVEWVAFCEVLGNPGWATEGRFATLMGRKENEDELDKLVLEWAAKHNAEEIVNLMQAKGIAAAVVYDEEDLYNDPQLKYRDHFVYLEHKVIERHAYHNEAIRFSKSPPRLWKAGPCLGEDNEYVYKEILGLTDDDISDLFAEGVITTEADLPI